MAGSGEKGLGGGGGWGPSQGGGLGKAEISAGRRAEALLIVHVTIVVKSRTLDRKSKDMASGTHPEMAGDGSCHRGSWGPSLSLDTQQSGCCSVSQKLFRSGAPAAPSSRPGCCGHSDA